MKWIIIGVCILVVLLISYLAYSGFFSRVSLEERTMGPYYLVYENLQGDYRGIKEIQDRIYYALLNDHGVETYKGFGIFYDNPKEVPTDQLRSMGGCILEADQLDLIPMLEEQGFQIQRWPEQKCLSTSLPFRGPLSPMAGIIRVYPAMQAWTEQRGMEYQGTLEIADIPEKRLDYLLPLE